MTIETVRLRKVLRPSLILPEFSRPHSTTDVDTRHAHLVGLDHANPGPVDLIANQLNEAFTGLLARLLVFGDEAALDDRWRSYDRNEDTAAEVIAGESVHGRM